MGEDYDRQSLIGRIVTDSVIVVRVGLTALSIQETHSLGDLTKRSIELQPRVGAGIAGNDIPNLSMKDASIFLVLTMMPAQQLDIVDAVLGKRRDEVVLIAGESFRLPIISIDSDLCWPENERLAQEVKAVMSKADIVFMNLSESHHLRGLQDHIPIAVIKRDVTGRKLVIRGSPR